jgi:hypothetical protein
MELPRKVQVGDRWYSVEVVEMMQEKRLAGRVSYVDRHIRVGRYSNPGRRKFTPGELNEAFWHEITHAILDDMGHRLSQNETFVTAFARRLARAVLSAREKE